MSLLNKTAVKRKGFMPFRRTLLLGTIAVMLTGCGFHFAGSKLAMENLPEFSIQTTLPSLWKQRLYRFLKVRDIRSYPSADLKLWIEDFKEDKRPVSLNSRAKVAEYSIEFSFSTRLTGPDGEVIMPEKHLTTNRIYRFNEQEVPGKQAEEDFLKQAMIDELFDQMLHHVDTALRNRDKIQAQKAREAQAYLEEQKDEEKEE